MLSMRRSLIAGRRVATDVVTWRPGRTTSEDTYLAARVLHRHTGGASSRLALSAIRAAYERGGVSPGAGDLDPAWRSVLAGIEVDGVSHAPPILDDEAVARVVAFASTAPAVLRSTSGESRRGTFADRDGSTASVGLVERFVLDQPDIQSIVANAAIRALAAARFRATPLLHPPILYWSCAGAQVTDDERVRGARQFHWDYDGLAGLRVHLYLTDVDEGAAPMSYIAGSHRAGGLRSKALRAADLGMTDAELWASYSRSDLRTMTGPAGTTFVSDSRGMHSGTDAVTADRLFLVMPMQATGFAGYQLRPREVRPRDPDLALALREGRPEMAFFRERGAAAGQ